MSCRAFDAGLRAAPFPDDTASLLPVATRTGLSPADDDELKNTKIHRDITSRCHLLFCWTREKPGLMIRPFRPKVPRGAIRWM